ncbi:MAG TPA: hypothetical protein VKF15_02520 [Nitrososphaerales archaeon]|nr:hypothetical protein [Nitrososphaerales archaeon]
MSVEPPTRRRAKRPEPPSDYHFSQLDAYLLRSLEHTKDEKEMSGATGVDAQVIRGKLELLVRLGYLTEDMELTEKGYDAVSQSYTIEIPDDDTQGPPPPLAQPPTEDAQPNTPAISALDDGDRRQWTRELVLGIIFMATGVLALIYYAAANIDSYIGGILAGSLAWVALGAAALLLAGLTLLTDSQTDWLQLPS